MQLLLGGAEPLVARLQVMRPFVQLGGAGIELGADLRLAFDYVLSALLALAQFGLAAGDLQLALRELGVLLFDLRSSPLQPDDFRTQPRLALFELLDLLLEFVFLLFELLDDRGEVDLPFALP